MRLSDSDLDLLLQHLLVGARGELSGWGIRDYSGQYNNALNPVWGSADRAFSSLASQVAFRAADVVPVGLGFGPPAGTPTAYDNTSTFIVDSHPREISNLIADEPVNIFSGLQTGVLNGLPTSKLHTLYGQFFTHDLDLVPKGANGTIVLNLLVGDPLYAISPFKFMTLSRANFTVVGGEREYSNLISSWVDLGPTYGTHPVMTALLKEYDGAGVAGVATGRLLEHTDPNPALNNGMPNWADVKANALRIGITLLDNDVLNLPMLRFNADGSLFRNASGSAEIELSGGLPVHTGHAFLDDLSRNAVPSGKTADIDSVIGLTGSGSTFYDDELLAIHFIAGDGRANENYMLTSVHGLFFAEHNRVYAELQALVAARGPAYAAQWSGEMLFEAARQVVEAQYSQISFDEYVARLTPNLDTYAAFAGALDPAVSNEFAHAIFRFGHTQTSPSHNVISQNGQLSSDVALLATFLAPATFATTNAGGILSGVGSHAYTTAELAGMARVRANEIDEFFVDGLRNTLLGLPLDLTAINIARGRDIGLPSLNALRRELFAQTGLGTLAAYTSWNDFGAHLLNPGSLKHFLMAYAGQALFAFQSTYATTTDWANARATDWAAYKLVLDTAATAALADTAFMGAGGNNNYELIDIYIGGLAEAHVPGGLLGSTYDFITAVTLGPLRNSDRFAELNRLFGSDLGYEVRGTTLADVIRNNATPVASVPAAASPDGFNLQRTRVYGDAFAVPDMILEIGTSGTWAATPPARPSGLQSYIDISDPRIGAGWSLGGSTFTATALSELIGGTALANTILAGLGNDTVYADAGADNVDGGAGHDWLYGGDGNDTLSGGADNDILHGQADNDNLAGGAGADKLFGEAGDDTLAGDGEADLLFGAAGNDLLLGGAGADELAGGDGADTLDGGSGADTLDGGGGADVAVYAGAQAAYTVAHAVGGGYTVTQISSGAIDALSEIETIQFTGSSINLSSGTVAINDLSVVEGQTVGINNTLANLSGLTITGLQWQQSTSAGAWVPIAGATGATLALAQAQVGHHVRVLVSFTDPVGAGGQMLAWPTAEVININNAASGSVSVAGSANVGFSLSAITTALVDIDGLGALSYQWLRNASPVAGATAVSYLLSAADLGATMSVRVNYTDAFGTPESMTSAPSALINDGNDPPSGSVTVSGSATIGSTLTAAHTLSDPDGLGAINWRWQSSPTGATWTNVVDLGTSSLVVNAALGGLLLRAQAFYTDGLGTPEAVASAATAIVPGITFNVINGDEAANNLLGTASADQINGFGGNDTLTGGAGTDLLVGGAGGLDFYFVDSAADGIIELSTGGYDVVRASVDYTLGANLEELWLEGTANLSATGNDLNNNFLGNSGGNLIIGGLGNDFLNGNTGADTLIGGLGNDHYVTDTLLDNVVEMTGEGVDKVSSFITWTLGANLENLTLLNSVAGDATGNELANLITGSTGINTLAGLDGNDTLSGLGGNDLMLGGTGVDTALYTTASTGSVLTRTGDNTYTVSTGAELDTLQDIEFAQFSNTTLALTTGSLAIDDSTPQAGQTLNVLSTLANSQSLTVTSTQWQMFDTSVGGGTWVAIAGATNFSFSAGAAQTGKALRVSLTFTDPLGAGQIALSAATAPVSANGANSPAGGSPTITGTPTEDQTLSANTSTITDADGLGAFSFEWLRAGSPIAAATNPTYTLADADVGQVVSLRVSFTDGAGGLETMVSAPTTPIVDANEVPTGSVAVSGIAEIGNTLVAAQDLADADGLGPINWRWQSSPDGSAWTNVVDLGPNTLVVNAALGGLQLRAQAFYTDARGAAEIVSSAATAVVPTIAFNVINGDDNANNLAGTAAADQINGLGGNDTLTGGAGADLLVAGTGGLDFYIVDSADDGVVELSTGGYDVVRTSTLSLALGPNIEELWIDGAASLDGWGNDLNNNLRANNGANRLFGAGGNDQLISFAGDDTLDGGAGTDTATFAGSIAGSSIVRSGDNAYTVTTGAEVKTLLNMESVKYTGVASTTALTTGTLTLSDITPSTGQLISALSTLDNAQALTITATQWQMFDTGSWVPIAGATNTSFTPGAAQAGKALRVALTFTDPIGAGQIALSAASAPVSVNNNPATGAVLITGTPTEDQTLSADTSGISDADGLGAFNFEWLRDGLVIAGANLPDYGLGIADVGHLISVRVGFVDAHGTAESLTSAATGPIGSANDPPTGAVIINGNPIEDQTLGTDTSTIDDPDGLGAFSYQWLRAGLPIDGATVSTYTLGDADVGQPVSVRLSFTDGQGFAESLTSAATAAVANVNDPATGSPTIGGTPTEDQSLTANTSDINDPDGLGAFSYQWLRAGLDVAGASASTYLLGDADVGQLISVRVSFTDIQSSSETLTSAATAAVANVNDAPAGAVTINGSATENQILSANPASITDADGLGPFNYQWVRAGSPIVGATAATYVLADADVGEAVSVRVNYIDGSGSAELLTSTATAAVINVNDLPTGSVSVSGTAAIGSTLTALHTLIDADGLGPLSWRWQSSPNGTTWTNVVDLGPATLVVNAALGGLRLRAQAFYTDARGAAEVVSSSATAVVPTITFNVINGDANNNTLLGTAAADQISGLNGNDTIDGGSGFDRLVGGAGNDFYTLDHAADGVVEAATSGFDVMRSGTFSLTLRPNVEELWIDGAAALDGWGNDLGNNLRGNGAANRLFGAAGNDQLQGFAGNDTMDGGAGADTATAIGLLSGSTVVRTGDNAYAVTTGAEVDTLLHIEFVRFISGTTTTTTALTTGALALSDTTPGVGQTISLLSTLANTQSLTITATEWQMFDAGAGGGSWVPIGGATNTSFTPGAAQVGKALRVARTFTDPLGAGQVAVSAASAPVGVNNTAAAGAVLIAGTPTEDQTLAADPSGISDADGLGAFSYTWLRAGGAVAGATGPTYTLGDADVGAQVSLRLSFTDGQGSSEVLTSTATAAVANVNDAPTGALVIVGSAVEDGVLVADTSTVADADGLGSLTYAWSRNAVLIAGATTSSYTLGDADVGAVVRARASWTDGHGSSESLLSALTAAVVNVNDPATGLPVIVGSEVENQVLTVDVTGIADPDGLGALSYRWTRDGVDVVGATGTSLTLGDADVGAQIRVRVNYTDARGSPESLTSLPTSAVSNVNDVPAGSVTVSDTTPAVGVVQTLTHNLTDADGMPAIVQAFWQYTTNNGALWTDVNPAGTSFLLTAFYANARFRGVVSYTDNRGTAELVTSAMTSAAPLTFNNINGTNVGETLVGTSAADRISGLGGNDSITGGNGFDLLLGGAGNDTYVVNNTADAVVEFSGEGTDLVQSSGTWTLGNEVENLTLTGSGSFSGFGNAANNVIVGNSGANILRGELGNDSLNGGAGADNLVGGAGNDTYVVDNNSDVSTELADEGIDLIQAALTWTLGANVENLTLTGSSAINGTGNPLANVITGNGANNTLNGGDGNDTIAGGGGVDNITGGTGADALSGGAGVDTFVYSATSQSAVGVLLRDLITDFLSASDKINLSGIDANTGIANNQAFTLIGLTSTFTAAGQLAYHTEIINGVTYTVIEGNVDADVAADFQIALLGNFLFPVGTPDITP